MNPKKFILKWVLPSAKAAYKLSATSAEVFCRHSFGQRYAPSLLGSFFFCFVFTSLMRALMPGNTSPLLGVYLLVFFVLVVFHLGRMWRPRARPFHSYSNGQSWSFWRQLHLRPSIVQSVLEPGIHVAVGLFIFPVDNLLSVWLLIAGLCLFVKELIGRWEQRNRLLDALDARAEGKRMNAAIRRHTASPTGGEQTVNPVVAAQQAQQPRNTPVQIIRNLDPALQRLISTPGQNLPVQPASVPQPNRPGACRYHAGPLGTLPRITSKRPGQ